MSNASPFGSCTRRDLLHTSGLGLGTIALAELLREESRGATSAVSADIASPGAAMRSHRATATSVIFLFMGGGPSQVDTWDPKPELTRLHKQTVPDSIATGIPRIARAPLHNLMASSFSFNKHGESGIEVSELYPNVARCVDDLCVIRSCRHDSPIHAPAEFIATTGTGLGDRPSLGAWLTYGLGSENRNLPGFVVFKAGETIRPPAIGAGFLPAQYQGMLVDGEKGVPNLSLPPGVTLTERSRQLALLDSLNRRHLQSSRHAPRDEVHHAERDGYIQDPAHSELNARIEAYAATGRLQLTAPAAFDLSTETADTQQMYGLDQKETAEFGKYCLWTRRLVERGVRFIQLRSGGWDAHSKLRDEHRKTCLATDRPIAALLADLKQRGLLDTTLVIWGGEFGRTPTMQGDSDGRDHSPSGYSMWLAGGGVKGSQIIGSTDPVGYAAIDKPVHPNDLHATILHALGVDQHHLTYRHRNRNELLTVNGGKVVQDVFG